MSEAKDALRDELITLMRGYVPPQSLEEEWEASDHGNAEY